MNAQQQPSNTQNPVMFMMFAFVVVCAMGIGFLGGYFAFGVRGATAPIAHQHGVAGATGCPHELDVIDQPKILGLMCPGSGETHTAFGAVLQSCHCGVAHAIKDQVKAAINANPKLTAQEIQADLAAKWGEKIKTGA